VCKVPWAFSVVRFVGHGSSSSFDVRWFILSVSTNRCQTPQQPQHNHMTSITSFCLASLLFHVTGTSDMAKYLPKKSPPPPSFLTTILQCQSVSFSIRENHWSANSTLGFPPTVPEGNIWRLRGTGFYASKHWLNQGKSRTDLILSSSTNRLLRKQVWLPLHPRSTHALPKRTSADNLCRF